MRHSLNMSCDKCKKEFMRLVPIVVRDYCKKRHARIVVDECDDCRLVRLKDTEGFELDKFLSTVEDNTFDGE